jgi:Na+/melibiose symporter-like transporter
MTIGKTATTTGEDHRLGGKRLLLFMLGQFGIMLLTRYLFQWLLKFSDTPTADGVLFAAATVGAVFLGYRIFDGVTDPMAGALADWWVSTGRARQQLLLLSVPIAPLGLILTFIPTAAMSEVVRWVVLASGLFVFFVGYTIYAIPYWTLVEDYGKHADGGRRELSNMLGLGLILATIAGFVVTPLLISQLGYRDAAVAVALLSFVCMLAPLYAAPPTAANAPPPATITLAQTFHSFLGALQNRRFLALLALLAGSQMSFTVLTAAAPFIATDLLEGTEKDVSLLLGPLILTAVPMFYFSPKVSRALGWYRALVVFSLLLGGVYFLCSVLIGVTLIHSPVITTAVLFALAGPMIAVLLALDAEAITGCVGPEEKHAVAMYFGAYNLVIKTLNGVAVSLTGVLVGLSKGAWGAGAIRFMVIAAALLLVSGVAGSLLIYRGGVTGGRHRVTDSSSPASQ